MTTTNSVQIVIDLAKEVSNTNQFVLEVVDNNESDKVPTCR